MTKSSKTMAIIVGILTFAILLNVFYVVWGIFTDPAPSQGTRYKLGFGEFYRNKEHFDMVADNFEEMFKEEYEKDNTLQCICYYGSTAYAFYSDSEKNYSKEIELSQDLLDDMDALYDVFRTGDVGAGLESIVVNPNQVIFKRGNGYQASVVRNNSIFEPDSLIMGQDEKEITASRLSLHWFQCTEREE